MKVHELIAALQQMDPDLTVVVAHRNGEGAGFDELMNVTQESHFELRTPSNAQGEFGKYMIEDGISLPDCVIDRVDGIVLLS